MDLTDLCLTKGVRDVAWGNPAAWSGSAQSSGNSAVGAVSVASANTLRETLTPIESYSRNIAVNAAVNAISSQLMQAQGRLFNRGGEEVVGGAAFDRLKQPAPGMAYRTFIREVVSWLNIAGEYGIRVGEEDGSGFPRSWLPLCPAMMEVEKPTNPQRPEDVIQWRYTRSDGLAEYVRGDFLAFDRLFNPNPYSVRGLSPLVVGSVQITGQVAAEQYNKSFFEQGGIPSHLVVLPDGTPRQHREDFERRYLSEYGRYNSNNHKVMVVAGKDVKVESLEQPFQDGAFMESMKRGDLKIGQLYRVPAINMGIYDKTRFDTANEERKLFLEETLMPQAASISACIQQQIIDRHYRFDKPTVRRPRSTGDRTMSKSMDVMFEKARAESESPLIFLIDPDTLPVASEVALSKAEHASTFRKAFMISPKKAEQWLKLDFDDDRPERDEIWAEGTNIVCITKPELNSQLTPGVGGPNGAKPGEKPPEAGASGKGPTSKPKKPKKAYSEADSLRKSQLKTLIHKLRHLTVKSMSESGELWSLAEADGLNAGGDKVLASEIRKARFHLRQIVEKHTDKQARVDAAKAWLDTLDGAYIRKALGL